ncbi:hypothetical protein [Streptomyces sp. NPDC002758]
MFLQVKGCFHTVPLVACSGGIPQVSQDLGLPDLDGLCVARALRGRFRDLLIVVLTAHTDGIDIIAGLDADADPPRRPRHRRPARRCTSTTRQSRCARRNANYGLEI